MYYLTALEVRSLKWVLQNKKQSANGTVHSGLSREESNPGLFQLPEAAHVSWLLAISLQILLHDHIFSDSDTPASLIEGPL